MDAFTDLVKKYVSWFDNYSRNNNNNNGNNDAANTTAVGRVTSPFTTRIDEHFERKARQWDQERGLAAIGPTSFLCWLDADNFDRLCTHLGSHTHTILMKNLVMFSYSYLDVPTLHAMLPSAGADLPMDAVNRVDTLTLYNRISPDDQRAWVAWYQEGILRDD